MKALWCGIAWSAALGALWGLVAALLGTLHYVKTKTEQR